MPFIIQYLPPRDLKSWLRTVRMHPDKQVKQLAQSIRRFGAAVELGLAEAPCIAIGHLRIARESEEKPEQTEAAI